MNAYRRRGALIAALLGFFIVMLDTTVVNVALARIGGDLGVPVTSLQWVVDAYALTFAALQLSAGVACDRMGARSVHLLGLAVFGLLSAACALAPAGGALIAFRALQGVGAAAIVPASLAMLSLIHDRPADRARAIGLWGGAGGIAAAVGPVAGGLLVTFTGWRLVFWVNLPLVAAALWLTARCLPEPTTSLARRREGGDLPGQVLSVAGLAATTYGIIAAGVQCCRRLPDGRQDDRQDRGVPRDADGPAHRCGRVRGARARHGLDAVPAGGGPDLPGWFRHGTDHARRNLGRRRLRIGWVHRSRRKCRQRGPADRQCRWCGRSWQPDRFRRLPDWLSPGSRRGVGRLRGGSDPRRRRHPQGCQSPGVRGRTIGLDD